jgi:hypothetical protein
VHRRIVQQSEDCQLKRCSASGHGEGHLEAE